ncbi:transposase [Pseudoalteromonas sp. MMG010]|uniref:REP-associated tyrosine transposase n=1 Tax=Pseudoalteromonas sp. MMG010 TaxID=2822685 RepID=UPI001B3A26D9|nr:transposase [Pseudoalteromonas sp. MMG010]MBQ4834064.1 transposase [Pseudoalteromonas sp. MMG010]
MSWSNLKKGRVSIQSGEYFITFTCHHRERIFSNSDHANTFCRCIASNELKYQCRWLTWVLMPDHFHGLLQLTSSELGTVVGHLKGASAREVNKVRSKNQPVWQRAYYDHALREEENRIEIARYIAANPLRRKLVSTIGDYPYWNSVYL